MDLSRDRKTFLEQWDLPWSLLEAVLTGRSIIDVRRLGIHRREQADRFLKSYGFDLDDPADAIRARAMFIEAIHFTESVLIPREWARGLRPPTRLLGVEDLRQLLIWASARESSRSKDSRVLAEWSCALLRLIHTVAHLDDPQRSEHFELARRVIQERVNRYVRSEGGKLSLGTARDHVPLEKLEWKLSKSRASILLKLLHKPANVTETLYDHIGLRCVTRTPADAIRLLAVFRQHYIIDFSNLVPTRTRNTLVDLEFIKKNLQAVVAKVAEGRISPALAWHLLDNAEAPHHGCLPSLNPHSSRTFRSIQLTCRQRLPGRGPSAAKNTRIFFPYEIHILDQAAYAAMQTGEARHDRYKASQIRAARKRVLGKLLESVSRK